MRPLHNRHGIDHPSRGSSETRSHRRLTGCCSSLRQVTDVRFLCGRLVVTVLGALLSVVLSAFVIGALARFALPGPDPMPFWLTLLLGLGGSLIGGGIAAAVFGSSHVFDSSGHGFVTLLLEIGAAIVLLASGDVLVRAGAVQGERRRPKCPSTAL